MLHGILLAIAWMSTGALALAEERPPESPRKPQWQQVLPEADAKQAEKLEKQIREAEAADKYADAVGISEELLALRQNGLGKDHHQTIDSRYQVAAFRTITKLPEAKRRQWWSDRQGADQAIRLETMGKFALALPLRQAFLKSCLAVLGEDDPTTASCYSNVAFDLYSLGKAAEAQPFFQKSLESRRKALGEDHPETATAYNNLAMNLKALGKIADAQPLLQKALEAYRNVLGDEHPTTANGYNNLGINLDALGRHHPEASAGPQDSRYLFRQFRELMAGKN